MQAQQAQSSLSKDDWLGILTEYLNRGWSVIPVNGKVSAISSWKEYQSKRPTIEKIKDWLDHVNFTGFAVITGRLSNLVVIDVDEGSTFDITELPKTLSVKSGKGSHYYFNYPKNNNLRSPIGFVHKTDIRAEGAYTVLPFSIHENGNRYEWISNSEIADFPEWLIDQVEKKSDPKTHIVSSLEPLFDGVGEGERNSKATKVVGQLLSSLNERDWTTLAWSITKLWNSQNHPPLSEKELTTVFNSIAEREKSQRQDPNSSDFITPKDFVSLDELYQTDFEDQKWLVERLIPKQGITCLAGEPKVGKSFLSLEIARCISLGISLFNKFETSQANVLIITKEDPEWMIKERFEQLQVPAEAPISIITHPGIFFDSSNHMDELRDYIVKKEIGFVIVDSLRRTIRGDENNSQSISPIHHNFKRFIKLGASVLFIHHYGKDNASSSALFKPRGSSDIPALVDSLIGAKHYSFADATGIELEQSALRQDIPIKPFVLEKPDFENGVSSYKFAFFLKEVRKVTKKELAGRDVLNELQSSSGLSQTDLITKLVDEMDEPEYQAGTVKSAIAELTQANKIISDSQKKYFLVGETLLGKSQEEEL